MLLTCNNFNYRTTTCSFPQSEGYYNTQTVFTNLAAKRRDLKCCSIHFAEKRIPCFFTPNCYTLPKDWSLFVKKISGSRLPDKLRKTLKKQLQHQISNFQNSNTKNKPLSPGRSKAENATLIERCSINSSNIEIEYVCSL